MIVKFISLSSLSTSLRLPLLHSWPSSLLLKLSKLSIDSFVRLTRAYQTLLGRTYTDKITRSLNLKTSAIIWQLNNCFYIKNTVEARDGTHLWQNRWHIEYCNWSTAIQPLSYVNISYSFNFNYITYKYNNKKGVFILNTNSYLQYATNRLIHFIEPAHRILQ